MFNDVSDCSGAIGISSFLNALENFYKKELEKGNGDL